MLREALARSDERTLAETKVPGLEWTAKDVLAHLIGYDRAVVTAIEGIRAGRPLAWPWTSTGFDGWNATSVGPRRDRPYSAVFGELETSRAALVRQLESWPEGAGPFGPDSWDLQKSAIEWIAPHEREHAGMIAKLGAG
ncbi:MAG TPA: maleylpyruvate isomerase N-terminal domain-containing protein [Candidatus Limnocylindria bacterium]